MGVHLESHVIPLYNGLKLRNAMLPLKLLVVLCVTDAGIILALCPSHVTHLNNRMDPQIAKAPSIVLLASHDTHFNTGTSTGTKSHVIPLIKHVNMTDAMVSVTAISASCDRKHVTAMNVPKPK